LVSGLHTSKTNNDLTKNEKPLMQTGKLLSYGFDYLFEKFMQLSNSQNNWGGRNIEYFKEIRLSYSDTNVYFCDFNDDMGYAVFNDFEIFKFVPTGDYPLYRSISNLEYSTSSGFVEHQDDEYYPVDNENDFLLLYEATHTTPYDGQSNPGDGEIYNISSYVSDKYSYKVQILWWTETRYAYFWCVDSGHGLPNEDIFSDTNGNKINWYDPNGISTSFMPVNQNSLNPRC
jgi:hypothetical protein